MKGLFDLQVENHSQERGLQPLLCGAELGFSLNGASESFSLVHAHFDS